MKIIGKISVDPASAAYFPAYGYNIIWGINYLDVGLRTTRKRIRNQPPKDIQPTHANDAPALG